MVLLSAPAGFGKTSLLSQQLAALPEGTGLAWVGCDAEDDLPRLASCLVAALDPLDLPWRTSPEALIGALNGEAEARTKLGSELVNALLATELPRGLLVFEDLHRIEDREVFAWLDTLAERLPQAWGLVLISRFDPPLALARRRVRGELVEFRQEDLRFNAEEVVRLLSLREAGEDAQDLLERTDGWPAGLGLLLERHGRGASRHEQHLFDYLASEVLDEMPAELRDFLLRTSVLPELSAGACAAVSGNARAAQLLEEIERRGLFVSVLDADERTLRLHDLFRAALADRLRRDHGAELPQLLRRAALAESDPTRRIGHLLRAQAWEQAADEVLELTRELLTHGALNAAQRLLDGFTPEQQDSLPALLLVRAITAWVRWDWPRVVQCAARSTAAYRARGQHAAAMRAQSYLCIGLIGLGQMSDAHRELDLLLAEPSDDGTLCRALLSASWLAMFDGELDRIGPFWEQMLDALERSNDLALWYECSPIPSVVGLPGARAPLQRYIASALQRLPDSPTTLRGICHVTEGRLRLWSGDMAGAMTCLRAADEDCRWLGLPVNLHVHLRLLQSLLQAINGEGAAAMAVAQAVVDEANQRARRVQQGALNFHALRVAVMVGDEERARQTARGLAELDEALRNWALPEQHRVVDGHLALLDGRLDEACRYWAEAVQAEARIDTNGLGADIRLRLADALLLAGRVDEAAEALRPLLARLRDDPEWGPVLLAGPAVLGRLGNADWSGWLQAEDFQRLRQWSMTAALLRLSGLDEGEGEGEEQADEPLSPESGTAAEDLPERSQAGAGELLSQREWEVLTRIAAGDSNKLIARLLDLSPHTVKRHVANILDKLGLSSRGQAAAWLLARR